MFRATAAGPGEGTLKSERFLGPSWWPPVKRRLATIGELDPDDEAEEAAADDDDDEPGTTAMTVLLPDAPMSPTPLMPPSGDCLICMNRNEAGLGCCRMASCNLAEAARGELVV